MQHAQRRAGPLQLAHSGVIQRDVLLIMQGRQHLMRQPLTQCAVLRHVMMNQQRQHAGLADHQLPLALAMSFQPDLTTLIRIELERGAFVQRPAHQTGKVGQAEPSLRLVENGAQGAAVAEEEGGFEMGGRGVSENDILHG